MLKIRRLTQNIIQASVLLRPSPLLFSLLFFCFPVLAQDQQDNNSKAVEEQAAKLESLKIHIKETEQDMAQAVTEKSTLQEELKESEINAGEVAAKLKHIQGNLLQQQQKLDSLRTQQSEQQALLDQERDSLAKQIRMAYMTGRNDYLKLLLNQEDPAKVSRVMAYYDYHNRSRSQNITKAIEQLQHLYDLEQAIAKETDALNTLKTEEDSRMQEFNRSREMRESILLRLERFISEKGEQLENLTAQAEALEKLLQKLNKSGKNTVRFFEDIPPFKTMKGKMNWPVDGKIVHRFGSRKKGGNLKWDGVLIGAQHGSEVRAINNGKVVFADWFRNLGLLMIIEHGDGYMSLYGHNESLLKKQGDWVLTGETIASAGDSGGQNQTGLYFEIRQKGKPVNPAKWCKK